MKYFKIVVCRGRICDQNDRIKYKDSYSIVLILSF